MRIRHALVHALATVAALGLGTLLPLAVLAQAYPNRPIQLIVPYPPGGSTEALARLVQAKLAASLGQAVVIDHRGGNAGNIGSADRKSVV